MIRFKVFIPFFILILMVGGFLFYRLDATVKAWIESGISAATETKTDISSLHISLKHSSLMIRRLQIASKEDEWKNLVEFEDIIIDFQTLPLLKKRFVIDNFSVKGIKWGTKRTKSGKLPPQLKNSEPTWLSEATASAFSALKLEISKLPISKLTDFSLPSDTRDVLDALNLQSEEAFKSSLLVNEQLRTTWSEKLRDIRDISSYEQRIQDIRNLVKNPPQDPKAILDAIETAKKTEEFFASEKNRIQILAKSAEEDLIKVKGEFDKGQKALEADIQRAKNIVGLNDLNIQNISKIIFGEIWLQRVETALRYHAMVRRAMASSTKDKDIEVKERAKGRDIVFVTPKKEPTFVLAQSDFSVKSVDDGDQKLVSQLYELKLRDINSNPKLYGKPTSIAMKADFRKTILESINFDALLDYTKEVDRDEFKLAAKGLVADGWNLGVPKLFPIILTKGTAQSSGDLKFIGDDFIWQTRLDLQNVEWDFSNVPNRGTLVPLLQDIFASVKSFFVDIKLSYAGKDFKFDISSDMDSKVKTGIEVVLQKKMAELETRLQTEIETRVAVYKNRAQEEVNHFKTDVEGRVNGIAQQALGYEKEAGNIEEILKKQTERAAEKKVQEGLKGLQKNLPALPKLFR